ncbi:hypothetical protein [Streptomyces sp. NPDC048442]|uniref:hypothetical protein n=1 Tax=Streptomyces sp. NPDC048442 TaxID=3154823 RepID=UPI0034166073
MTDIHWEDAFCGEGNNCFRIGTDDHGNGYVALLGQEDNPLTDTHEALRNLIRDIKSGKADHLL